MPEKTQSHFSRTVKNLIQQHGITFEELASHIGVTKQTVSNYCSGKSVPNYDVLIKIAEYFGVSGDFLLTGVRVQDKADSKELGLSGEAIRLLKECDKKTFNFIDAFLSDAYFYSILSDAVHSMNFESINVFEIRNKSGYVVQKFVNCLDDKNNISTIDVLCIDFVKFKINNGNKNIKHIKNIKSYFEKMLIKKSGINFKVIYEKAEK